MRVVNCRKVLVEISLFLQMNFLLALLYRLPRVTLVDGLQFLFLLLWMKIQIHPW